MFTLASVWCGLTNSVDRYATTTMWHVADALAALVAAHELQLVDRHEFDTRVSKLLHFLNTMPLFGGRLPNTVYNASTGAMVNYGNQPEEVGWSAIDLGRLLIWLRLIAEQYPEFSEYIDKAVLRWNFCEVLDRCDEPPAREDRSVTAPPGPCSAKFAGATSPSG